MKEHEAVLQLEKILEAFQEIKSDMGQSIDARGLGGERPALDQVFYWGDNDVDWVHMYYLLFEENALYETITFIVGTRKVSGVLFSAVMSLIAADDVLSDTLNVVMDEDTFQNIVWWIDPSLDWE